MNRLVCLWNPYKMHTHSFSLKNKSNIDAITARTYMEYWNTYRTWKPGDNRKKP
jgi:hypothetical protein